MKVKIVYSRKPRTETQTIKLLEGNARNALLAYKRSAAVRGLSFTLSDDEVFELFGLPCYYCGLPPSNVYDKTARPDEAFIYSGIDRVNNSKGYERGNVVPCCKSCNQAKGTKTFNEFVGWIERLRNHVRK